MRIGVYICRAERRDGGGVNLESVGHYAANLPQVEVVRSLGVLPKLDPEALADEIAAERAGPDRDRRRLARLLQAGVHARHGARRAASPTRCGSPRSASTAPSGDGATERAKAIVACAVLRRARSRWPRGPNDTTVEPGHARHRRRHRRHPGGARDRRRRARRSTWSSARGTIGGHMAMFDKTFPTLDCAACILTPKMVAVGQHEMIDLMTYSEVESVSGVPGRLPGHGPAARAPRRRGRLRRLRRLQRRLPGPRAERVRRRHRRAQGRSTSRSRRRCPTPTWSTRRPAPTCRATGRSAAPASRSAPRSASTSTHADDVAASSRSATSSSPPATRRSTPRRIERYGYGVLPQRAHRPRVRAPDQRLRPDRRHASSPRRCSTTSARRSTSGSSTPRAPSPRSVAIIHCVGSRDAQLQRLLLARLLHVLAQVRAPRAGEAARRGLLRVLHRHARLRQRATRSSSSASRTRGRSSCAAGRRRSTEHDGQMVRQGRGHPQRQRASSSRSTWCCWPSASCRRRARTSWPRMLGIPRDDDGWFTEARLQRRPDRHGARRRLRGRRLPGPEGHPRHRRPGLGGGGAGARGRHRRDAGSRASASLSLADIEARAKSLVPASLGGCAMAITGQPQADRGARALRRRGREEVLPLRQLLRGLPASPTDPYVFPRKPMRYLQMGLEEQARGPARPLALLLLRRVLRRSARATPSRARR